MLYLYESKIWSEYKSAKDNPVEFETVQWNEIDIELDTMTAVMVIKLPFTFFAQVSIGANGEVWSDRGHLMLTEQCGPMRSTYDVDMASPHAKCYVNRELRWLVVWLR